jgi:hypothetical protein
LCPAGRHRRTLRSNISRDGQWSDVCQSQQGGLQGVTDVRVCRSSSIYSTDAVEPHGRSHDKAMKVYTATNVAMTPGFKHMEQRSVGRMPSQVVTNQKLQTFRYRYWRARVAGILSSAPPCLWQGFNPQEGSYARPWSRGLIYQPISRMAHRPTP